jgi:hypothetical protein
MSPLPNLYQFLKKLPRFMNLPETSSFFLLGVFFLGIAPGVSAQTVTWTDRFQQGIAPSREQCQKWGTFLKDLGGKQFASVTMTGEYDTKGRTITDPAAATKLAALIHLKEEGVVVSDGYTWRVTHCDFSVCDDGRSISVSVNGAETCACADTYTLRPQSKNADWGGINTGTSCNAKSQYMKLEFHSGVSIVPEGPLFICQGGSIELKAESEVCLPVESYVWTNQQSGESVTTGQSFIAREPGFYSVTAVGANGCSASSSATEIAITDVKVDAGQDVTYCNDPVALNATGSSEGGTGSTMITNVCLFDAFGLFGGGGCKFASGDICMDGTERITRKTYSQAVSFSNPVELRYKLYHSANSISEFVFLLNGEKIDSYIETNTAGTCTIIGENGAPFTFAYTADKFKKHWLEGSLNTLAVAVSSSGTGVDLAGIAVEVVTSDESYSWSPVEGLDVPTIKNPIATPTESTTYTVTYTDPSGCIATDQVLVKVCSTAPTAVCQEVSAPVDENSCTATVDASAFDGGSTSPSEGALRLSASPAGPYPVGITEVILTVTDANGSSSTCETKVTVTDSVLPEIAAAADVIADNDDGECFATIELEQPEASDNCQVTVSRDFEGKVFPVGETIVTWTATDASGNKKATTQKVTVVNASPVLNSVETPKSFLIVNNPVSLTVNYSDNNIKGATIDWADGSDLETVIQPANSFEVLHTYLKSGSYSVYITLTDKCGGSTYSYTSIAVSSPRSGSMSGGGWFNSPRGAYVNDQSTSGKVTFALHASNVNRNRIPNGYVVFNFHEAKLKFRSTELERFRLEDDAASVSAVGRLNGDRGYQILVSVAKGDRERNYIGNENHASSIDLIRVKMLDPNGNVIYDTQPGSPDDALATTLVKEGSVVLKEEELFFNAKYDSPVATSFGEETSSVYPNPFTDWVDVEFNSASNENVAIQVIDLSGKVIFNEVFSVSEEGRYPLDIPEREKGEPGIYMLVIKQGKKVEVLRLVRN